MAILINGLKTKGRYADCSEEREVMLSVQEAIVKLGFTANVRMK